MIRVHLLKIFIKVLRSTAYKLVQWSRSVDVINLLTKGEREILRRNKIFKDKHRGQRAFIIVNGPSLKQQNIDWLGEEITFVVSGFYRHEVIRKWQPTYYSIIDKNFFDGSEQSLTFFRHLNEAIQKSIFFLPLFRGLKANNQQKLVAEDRAYYFALAGPPNDKLDMTGVIQSFFGVSAFALAQAIYMGCSPIYLLGFDHDYLANRGKDHHFYSGGTIPGAVANTQTLAERIPYDVEMQNNYKLWMNYRSLLRIARKKGIRIYNATSGGYLDVFERRDFNTLGKKDSPVVP
jgi:hypothetical protein